MAGWPEEYFETLHAERDRAGLATLSVGEADTREPGPPMVALGWSEHTGLVFRLLDGSMAEYEPVTMAEFRERFPYCRLQAPAGVE